MKIKRNMLSNLIIIIILALFTTAMPAFSPHGVSFAGDEQSSFEYKTFTQPSQYLNELKKKMNNVYKAIGERVDDARTIPIPGLVSTVILEDGKSSESSEFVPQGLCRAGDYMLITAYDVKKKHNTVIYAVDMKSYELVSTLTLPNKYHAGGIAFDGEVIWMTGDTSDKYKGEPFVQYMTYEVFQKLIKKPVNEVSKDDISGFIYIKNKPSFLECDNGTLWVGTYKGRKGTPEGYLNGYKIVGKPENRKLNTMMYSIIAGIDASAQGADIDGDYLYVSSSYSGAIKSVKSSFITKYNIKDVSDGITNFYAENHEISRIEVPKMNEEILVDGSTIHINFESGATHWKSAVVNTDRILAVRKSLWRQ